MRETNTLIYCDLFFTFAFQCSFSPTMQTVFRTEHMHRLLADISVWLVW